MVGTARFELATFCPPDKRANQAALRPDVWFKFKDVLKYTKKGDLQAFGKDFW